MHSELGLTHHQDASPSQARNCGSTGQKSQPGAGFQKDFLLVVGRDSAAHRNQSRCSEQSKSRVEESQCSKQHLSARL